MIPFRKLLAFAALGAILGFFTTIAAVRTFDFLGGSNIVVNGERTGEISFWFLVAALPLNSLIGAVTAVGADMLFFRGHRDWDAAAVIAVGYLVGVSLSWAAQSAPFVPYYSITQPLVYVGGPLGVLIFSIVWLRVTKGEP